MDPVINPFLTQLQAMYGSFDPERVQTRRRSYYSYVAYPAAGRAVFNFFGQSIGGANRQLTNLQQAGRLDNPFIVKAVKTGYFITAQNPDEWAGTDASTLYSDIVNGLFQVGVLRVTISSKEWMTIPCPFLYAPQGEGMPQLFQAGNQGTNLISRGPFAYLSQGRESAFVVDPSFLIGNLQNFLISLEYPSGVVPAIATTIVSSDTTLYIGCELDGIEVRPVQ